MLCNLRSCYGVIGDLVSELWGERFIVMFRGDGDSEGILSYRSISYRSISYSGVEL